MKMVFKGFSVLALVGCFAAPSFAQDSDADMDMSKTTCGDLMKMDKDGMMMAAENADMMMKTEMQAEGKSDAEKMAMREKEKMAMKEKMDKMTDAEKTEHMKMTEDSMMKMETACKGKESMMVMDAMKG